MSSRMSNCLLKFFDVSFPSATAFVLFFFLLELFSQELYFSCMLRQETRLLYVFRSGDGGNGTCEKAQMRCTSREDSPVPLKMRKINYPTAENMATAYSGSVVLVIRVPSSTVPLLASHWRPHEQMQTHSVGGGAHLMSGKGEGRGV